MMRFTILILAMLATASCLMEINDRIAGRVIHIESLRNRGEWTWTSDYHDGQSFKYYTGFRALPINEIFYDCKGQFLISQTDDGYLMMESVCPSYRNRFLSAGYPDDENRETVLLVAVSYKPDATDSHWKVKCEDESMESCQFIPRRWMEKRATHTYQDGPHTPGGYWFTIGASDWDYFSFRIYAPNPEDEMKEIFSHDNCDSDSTATYKREVSIGVSHTSSSSHTIEQSTSIEVGGAFKAASASASSSISNAWANEESTTYQASITKSLQIDIPARKFVKLFQLTGYYAGEFSVGSETYRSEDQGCGNNVARKKPVTYHKKTTRIDLSKPGKVEL